MYGLDLHLVAKLLSPLDTALDDALAVVFVAVIGVEMFITSARHGACGLNVGWGYLMSAPQQTPRSRNWFNSSEPIPTTVIAQIC